MKKAGLILLALFSASFIMAQNKAMVTETGDGNASFVNQQGIANTATITQIGDKNAAATSDVHASSLYGVLTGTKGITQEGDGNTGTISQTNLYSGAVQAGPTAGMGQNGDHNTATITQAHNNAWMQEYAWLKQTGDGNVSVQNQLNTFAFSHVYQQGIAQVDPQNLVGNFAETKQIGGYAQNANIWQVGARNKAYQSQGLSNTYTESNLAEATQKGNNNTSHQYQNGSSNISKAIQNSNWNTANLTQNGNGNGVVVLQKTGSYNVINLTQNGGAQANIVQDGSNNTLMGIGLDIMATSLNGSILDLDQIGMGNTLQLQQTKGAIATDMQNGLNNTAVVIQN